MDLSTRLVPVRDVAGVKTTRKVGSLENFAVKLAQQKFTHEQIQCSVNIAKTGDTHILFYESFLEYPLCLEEICKISARAWALAFLQRDLTSITRVLCESIFTQNELDKIDDTGARALPSTKKLAILRAAKWLTNKCQDPWSYKPGPFPTDEERDQIEFVLKTFEKVSPSKFNTDYQDYDSDDQMGIAPTAASSHLQKEEIEKPLRKLTDAEGNDMYTINTPQNNHLRNKLEQALNQFGYIGFYETIMEWAKDGKITSMGNSAQTAKALTKQTIPYNADVFVDAVQFSQGRLSKAVQQTTIEKSAEILFRKFLRTDFENNERPFNNLDDLTPPKQLALIRAVAWIQRLKDPESGWENCFSFDSSILAHNRFLSVAEVNRIYNYISKTYGTHDSPALMLSLSAVSLAPRRTTTTTSSSQLEGTPRASTCLVQLPVINETMIVRGQSFSATCLNKALDTFRLHRGAEKAGKLLLEKIFTYNEIMHHTISGRGNKGKLPEEKILAIFDVLAYLNGVVKGARGPIPFSQFEKANLTKRIFTEHPNYLRQKQK